MKLTEFDRTVVDAGGRWRAGDGRTTARGERIPVVRPFLPPLREVHALLEEIWASGVCTNNGPLVQRLERELRDFLGVRHVFVVSNGTVGLKLGLKALGISGKVVTTPFSFAATVQSIIEAGCEPVFSDVDGRNGCMDPDLLSSELTNGASAVMPVHIYGNLCDIDRIAAVAREAEVPVVYDAAQAFGTTYRGRSALAYGDIAVLSLHAYKLFHTVEGGAVITDDDAVAERIYRQRYFGMDSENRVREWGTNGKTSELNAAIGIRNLAWFPKLLEARRRIAAEYDRLLAGLPIDHICVHPEVEWNCAYYPLILASEDLVLSLQRSLEASGVMTRRYFYPALNTLPVVTDAAPMPAAEDLARRVLCLPSFHGLSTEDIERIACLVRAELSR